MQMIKFFNKIVTIVQLVAIEVGILNSKNIKEEIAKFPKKYLL